jgi:transmembrane sensor
MTDKPKIVQFPDLTAIEAEAAAWVARFDGGDVSAEDFAKFQRWLNQSAKHREAVEGYGRLWAEFDSVKQLSIAIETGRSAAQEQQRTVASVSRRWFAYAVSGSIAAALAIVVVYRNVGIPRPFVASYETTIGSQKNAVLPDGSTVILNTNSRIDVTISGERRDVRLVRGEAYFEVAHDTKRPFTVLTGNGHVRDVGTAFDVRLLNSAVAVSVTQGSVELLTAAAPGNSSQRLGVVDAGRSVLFNRTIEKSEQISDADLNRRLAWRQGVLIYAGEPLADVMADIGRYSNIEIELDPRLNDRRIGGSFKISQIREVFTALESNFGIHSEWVSDKYVRLSSTRRELTPAK